MTALDELNKLNEKIKALEEKIYGVDKEIEEKERHSLELKEELEIEKSKVSLAVRCLNEVQLKSYEDSSSILKVMEMYEDAIELEEELVKFEKFREAIALILPKKAEVENEETPPLVAV